MRKFNLRIVLIISAVIHLQITPSLSNQTDVQQNSVVGRCVYYYGSDRYTCDLHDAVISSPDQVLIITGNHLPNHDDFDVQVLIHRNVSISYFNGEVLRKFTNLEYLAMGAAGVSQIGENAFDVCANLDHVYIGFNSLTTFPPGMLRNCVKLRHFDLLFNSLLASIPEDLFGTTSNLEIFDIPSNRLSSLPTGILQNMRNLKQFIIRSNSIANIDRNLLANAANLEKVDLAENPISNTTVITNLLNGHWSLNSIRISNRFPSIDFTFFSQFTQLSDLLIGGQPLTNIDWKSLPASLTSIYISNIAEEIPANAFNHLTNLRSLGFTGNGITSLHENTFKQLVNLNSLGIQTTRIRTLPPNIFVNQTQLTQLYLSHNSIEELSEGLFAPLVNIGVNSSSASRDDLILSGNRIRRLNANSFGYHPHLKSLRLAFNDIREIEREIFSRFPNPMEIFDLTYNNCTSSFFWFESNLHNDERLENCFNNWAGITTTVPPPGAAVKIGAGIFMFLITLILIIY